MVLATGFTPLDGDDDNHNGICLVQESKIFTMHNGFFNWAVLSERLTKITIVGETCAGNVTFLLLRMINSLTAQLSIFMREPVFIHENIT